MSNSFVSFEPLGSSLFVSNRFENFRNALESVFVGSVIDEMRIGDSNLLVVDNGYVLIAYVLLPVGYEVSIPSVDFLKLKLGFPDQQLLACRFFFHFEVHENIPFWRIYLQEVNLVIMIDEKFLRKVDNVGSGYVGSEISLKTSFSVDHRLNYYFELGEVSLPLSYIGSTDFKISAEKIEFDLSPDNPVINLKLLKLVPPQDLFPDSLAMPAFLIRDAIVSRNGFSGKVVVEWDLVYNDNRFLIDIKKEDGGIERRESTLFSIPGGINRFEIHFENSIPVFSDIKGLVRLPYFGEDISVEIILSEDGKFQIKLNSLSEEGVLLTKEDLLTLYLRSFTIDSETSSVSLSGGLKPLLYSAEGYEVAKNGCQESAN